MVSGDLLPNSEIGTGQLIRIEGGVDITEHQHEGFGAVVKSAVTGVIRVVPGSLWARVRSRPACVVIGVGYR
jgi:hypothetical protein